MKPIFVLIQLITFGLFQTNAQNQATSAPTNFIKGKVIDANMHPLSNTNITYSLSTELYHSDSAGNFKIPYIIGNKNILTFSRAGKITRIFRIPELEANEDFDFDVTLSDSNYLITTYTVQGRRPEEPTGHINFKPMNNGPGVSGDFMDGIKTLPGVASGNELSSQYNVRGGSYDENLIYVNDMEIYRPQLIRSGQQEGLSFVNGDLVSNVSFSAGGFEAKYGDKLSSVLDVSYRTPKKTAGGFSGGLLGGSAYIEGIKTIRDKMRDSGRITKFTYLIGARYRGNKNVLKATDVSGSYKSRFSDFQSLFVYHLNKRNRIELLINLAQNQYRLEPEHQETTFGTLQNSLRLSINFEGQEIMDYNSAMSGLSYIYYTKTTELKFIASAFVSQESEHYDVQGQYDIKQVNNNLGSSSFGDATTLLGLGYFINHARNDLYFTVANIAHQGLKKIIINGHTTRLLWGIKYQTEVIHDRFKEWKYSDSSGYNMSPYKTDKAIELNDYINSKTDIINHKTSGFVQYQKGFGQFDQVNFTVGTRYHFSSLNQQSLISPRAQLYYEPNRKYNQRHRNDSFKKKNTLIKFAFGYYYQPPFYREMRNFDGVINTNLKAQRSIHGVSGLEFGFKKWGRPFKFMVEGYYKQLDYLVPYLLDNVRIRYYATNTARGYATGIDSRLNGEFIKGIESWFSLSVLKTDEKIMYVKNGNTIETPFLRRPTDRRVSASIMFQDELNSNPDYRVHLMMNFGSGLPYYLGGDARYTQGNRLPPYRRVDIGFSKVLLGGVSEKQKLYAVKHKDKQKFETLWLGVDVYNLLQINNVISYIWVKDFQNNTYGVPNYLTGRRLNVKLVGKF